MPESKFSALKRPLTKQRVSHPCLNSSWCATKMRWQPLLAQSLDQSARCSPPPDTGLVCRDLSAQLSCIDSKSMTMRTIHSYSLSNYIRDPLVFYDKVLAPFIRSLCTTSFIHFFSLWSLRRLYVRKLCPSLVLPALYQCSAVMLAL